MRTTRNSVKEMRMLFYLTFIALSITCITSCGNSSTQGQTDVDSLSATAVEDSSEIDSISARGDLEVFGAESPSGTEVQSEGFGRCLESGCYCKEFKGRGQTCRNCGHAYKRHY